MAKHLLRPRPFQTFVRRGLRMQKPGSQPANRLVIRFVTAMLIFARHRLRNRIMSAPVAAIAMIVMAAAFMGSWF